MVEGCPAPSEDCPYFWRKPRGPLKKQQSHGCSSDEHHLMWPKRNYQSPLERQFRELPENKEQTCRWEHDEIHQFDHPPKKPTAEAMISAIARAALEEGLSHEQAA